MFVESIQAVSLIRSCKIIKETGFCCPLFRPLNSLSDEAFRMHVFKAKDDLARGNPTNVNRNQRTETSEKLNVCIKKNTFCIFTRQSNQYQNIPSLSTDSTLQNQNICTYLQSRVAQALRMKSLISHTRRKSSSLVPIIATLKS